VKSGATVFSLIVNVLPRARQPATSRRYGAAGDSSSGERARSSARANDAAVTGSPLLNRRPDRIVKVYVSRSDEICGIASARSGARRVPV